MQTDSSSFIKVNTPLCDASNNHDDSGNNSGDNASLSVSDVITSGQMLVSGIVEHKGVQHKPSYDFVGAAAVGVVCWGR